MGCAPRASARGEIEKAGLRFRERDELLHRIRRHRRMRNQDVGRGGEIRDRREIADRIVAQVFLEIGPERHGADPAHHQCVSVRCRMRHGFGADRSAGPHAVVDDDGLPQPFGESLQHDASRSIDAATGRVRHDETDRPHRVGVLRGDVRRRNHSADDRHHCECCSPPHAPLLRVMRLTDVTPP